MTPTPKEGPPMDGIDNAFTWVAILEWIHGGNFRKAKKVFLDRCKEIRREAVELDEKRRAALEKIAQEVKNIRVKLRTGQISWGVQVLRSDEWKLIVEISMDLDELDALTPTPKEKEEV